MNQVLASLAQLLQRWLFGFLDSLLEIVAWLQVWLVGNGLASWMGYCRPWVCFLGWLLQIEGQNSIFMRCVAIVHLYVQSLRSVLTQDLVYARPRGWADGVPAHKNPEPSRGGCGLLSRSQRPQGSRVRLVCSVERKWPGTQDDSQPVGWEEGRRHSAKEGVSTGPSS